ncbi:MAG: hypothetical protein Q8O16_05950, partial [Dehalococcoidia bacterium]|nr:hypothetical protein [Dehalococcoidia bacterium]
MAQLIKLIVIIAMLAGGGGTAYAINNPQSAIAAPFKAPAVAVLNTTASALKMIKDTKTVAASLERKIVSTSVHAMLIAEGLSGVTPVTTPTNDMTSFPSKQHPLYPNYLDSQKTQFKYTVDSKGSVTIDATE